MGTYPETLTINSLSFPGVGGAGYGCKPILAGPDDVTHLASAIYWALVWKMTAHEGCLYQ